MNRFLNIFSKNKEKTITVVSGLPRSGTSLMMKMLESGGIPPLIDHQRKADEDNPKGYYEFERVKKLPDGDTDWLTQADGKVVKIITALLPYLPKRYSFQVIIMERDIHEILISQQKMLVRRGENPKKIDDSELIVLFKQHLQDTEKWLQNHKDHITYQKISYNYLIQGGTESTIHKINQFLGKKLDTKAMSKIIDPSLYRSKK